MKRSSVDDDASAAHLGQATPQRRRFHLVRKLGAGAMGVVFHAEDLERDGQDVAVKFLRQFDASALLRFKREFRALTDVTHPNLVSLYELISADDGWMFTMELIDGVDLMSHIRVDPPPHNDPSTVLAFGESAATVQTVELSRTIDARANEVRCAGTDEIERLRACLPQLVDAVRAVHRSRKLHRDLKPSNVLVDRSGRVVVLDFGVAVGLVGTEATVSDGIVGTPAYMAPEQAAGASLTPAADWYAVGVMMYEALSGRRPFEGDALRVIADKAHSEPPPIHVLVPDAPRDLLSLCGALLHRDPSRRPGADEIQAQLRPTARKRRLPTAAAFGEPDETLLVGRDAELETMRESLSAVECGAARVLHVRGQSGMGKSSLVETLLRDIEERDQAVVLRGRCYERESVPYKALDNLIDAVTAHLSVLDEDELAAIVPLEMTALVRLFPVLRRVDTVLGSLCLDAVLSDQPAPGALSDPIDLRRRAFAALRALFDNLARRRTLVLYIDDLQWGDADSAELLARVFREPGAPPALLILAYRPEEKTSAFLRTFMASQRAPVVVSVGKLPLDRSRELARELLSRAGIVAPALADSIARESGGSPFFVGELTRYAISRGMTEQAHEQSWNVSLEEVLYDRIDTLPAESQSVLELVAVAARPLPQAIALAGAGLSARDAPLFSRLRTDHLVSTRGLGAHSVVETAHDRIRETITARLSVAARKGYHSCIARELEASSYADPEAIAAHLEASGQLERIAGYLISAAEEAAEALAFDRAAKLYQRALNHTAKDAVNREELWVRLGEALGYAGRSAAAADAYLAGAELRADGGHDLTQLAAEHLLYSGEIDRGVGVLRGVLAEVGITLRRSPRLVLLSMLARRARLALRRGTYEARNRTATIEERKLLDACWSATIGFSLVDNVRGVDFGARYLLAALDSGDAYHIARGLSMDACFVSFSGGRADRRARAMAARAVELAEETARPDMLQWAQSSVGFVLYQAGDFKEALEPIRRGIELFMRYRTGFAWELNSMRAFETWTLFYLGELRRMDERVSWMLRDARDRGDLHTTANMSTGLPSVTLLARDEPQTLRRQAAEAMSRWTPEGVHIQHAWEMFSFVMVDLYEGKTAEAIARLNSEFPRLKRAILLRIQMLRYELVALRAGAHLMHVASSGHPSRHLRIATRDARHLRRGHVAGFRHIGLALTAGIQVARGRRRKGQATLEQALTGFAERGMKMHLACGRLRLAQLIGRGHDRADALRADACAWMSDQGVVAPEAFARLICPGPFEQRDQLAPAVRGDDDA